MVEVLNTPGNGRARGRQRVRRARAVYLPAQPLAGGLCGPPGDPLPASSGTDAVADAARDLDEGL